MSPPSEQTDLPARSRRETLVPLVGCSGCELSDDELAALEALDRESLESFASTLDKRNSETGEPGFK